VFDVLSDRPRPAVPQEKDKLVAEVMRYMLFKSHQTSGCPIKREELTSVVTKNYRQRALPTLVINEARDRLAATFGYEMRELQRTRAPSARPGRPSQPLREPRPLFLNPSILDLSAISSAFVGSRLTSGFLWGGMCSAYAEAKSYILVSQLDNEVFSKYVEDKEAAPLSGFAFTVISVIHLAGGKISEGKGRGVQKLFASVSKSSRSDVS
jgi:hypothetical protein